MALLGARAYWRLFPILALLFFMVPAGDALQPILRCITIKSIELCAAMPDCRIRPRVMSSISVPIAISWWRRIEPSEGNHPPGLIVIPAVFLIAPSANIADPG
jgi:hypothetical protein